MASGLLAATATQWISAAVLLVLLGVLCYALIQVREYKMAATIVSIMVAAAAFFLISLIIAISGSDQTWEDFKKFVEDIFPFLDLSNEGDDGGTTTTTG